jgi:hypothetical protein
MQIVEMLAAYGPRGLVVGVVVYLVIRLIDRGFTLKVPPKRR